MKSGLLVLILSVMTSAAAVDAFAQRPTVAPRRYEVFPDQPSEFGYVEPPHYLDHLAPAPGLLMAPAASWDWRALGGVTPVKNQGAFGTCWAFAAHGDLESKILINDGLTKDYSELNIQACNPVSTNCNSGGNAWMSTNYLSLLGSVEESCHPYPGGCPTPTCVNPSCEFLKQVTEWRVIPNDVTAIKNALMTYGPVYTSMYASFPGFGSYNGTYCLQYTGSQNPNHAVLIVGFDDAMCGGNGAWIVKNSWGTGWGDNGYFYIQYEHARMGTNSNVITGYRDYDPDMTLHHWDEWGWWSSVGYGDGHDYAVVEIVPQASNEFLHALHFWATSGPTTYTLRVYDDFDGNGSGMPTNPLTPAISGTVNEAGYYTLELATTVGLQAGDPIYIYADLNTGSYVYPIPFDPSGPMETNKSFISNDGTFFEALDNGKYAMGDIGLRATIGPESLGERFIKAWGSNSSGQCRVPAPNADFVAVAGGGSHGLGLKSEGTIVAWGSNDDGQCDVPAPNADFVAVAGGWVSSLGLKQDGTIVAWGNNNFGQCDVPAPNGDFIGVAAGGGHSLGLRSDGMIVAWGWNDYGQCNVPAPNADFIALAAGVGHSLGLRSDGTITAWGLNSNGQCDIPAPNAEYIAVAAGGYHSLGLKQDGTIVAWGSNSDGQCDVPAPNEDFFALAGGWAHSLGLMNDGSIVAWGSGSDGQNVVPAPNEEFIAVAAGGYHSLGIKQSAAVETAIASFRGLVRGLSVHLTWALAERESFSGCHILRAEGAGEFERITAAPLSPETRFYVDGGVLPGRTYRYQLELLAPGGRAILSLEESVTLPAAALFLEQNYPNPFNPATTISFYVPAPAPVRLAIYDTAGRRVRTLLDGEVLAGRGEVVWDGRSDAGRPANSGIYYCRLEAGKITETRKLVLLK